MQAMQQQLPHVYPNLVALCSPVMGSGKSEVAKVFIEQGYVLVKFAHPLKEMVRALFRSIGVPENVIERMVEGDLKEEVIEDLGVTPRFLMQTLGTEWGRQTVNENLWTTLFSVRVRNLLARGKNVICDDMRFSNEVETVKALGGTSVRVVRPSTYVDQVHRNGGYHASEGELDFHTTDFLITNSGTLDDLRENVLALIRDRF